MATQPASPRIRLAELVAALSLATDLGMGQPLEQSLCSCVLAMRLGEALGMDEVTLREVYYQALLRYIGCNAETYTLAAILGDEFATRADYATVDAGKTAEVLSFVIRRIRTAYAGAPPWHLARLIAEGLRAGPSIQEGFSGHKRALDDAAGGPFDLVLCPACSLPAFTHGASRNLTTAGAYALLYNVLGYPAGVVPVSRVRPGEESERHASRDVVERTARLVETGSAGLPVGVQVVARPWREHVALAAMSAIEEVAASRDGYPAMAPIGSGGNV